MKIVIIGNGISGITAARWIRKLSDHDITVISAESDYFFSRTALMYIYMGHLPFQDTQPYEPHFWEKNRIQLMRAWVREIDFNQKILHLENAHPASKKGFVPVPDTLSYHRLIIATGSVPNTFNGPGKDLKGVGSLYALQDLDYMEYYSKNLQRAVVVGGGLIGIEMAEMFRSRNIDVTFLVRENSYWNTVLPAEESEMVNRHIQEHGIDLRLGTELKEICGDEQGKVTAVITQNGEKINCGFVGITIGVHPNVAFLKGTELDINKGIRVNQQLCTNIPDVYAIGDCAELRYPQEGRRAIESIWYTGRMMGEVVAHHINGHTVSYDPGLWFNSAKFLDIEYQVYGHVPTEVSAEQATLYWEHPNGKKSIRLVYDKKTEALLGVQVMGIRYRQEVCQRWIVDKTAIATVIEQLPLANFDPEFYTQYEQKLADLYNEQKGQNIQLKKKRSLTQVLRFLRKK